MTLDKIVKSFGAFARNFFTKEEIPKIPRQEIGTLLIDMQDYFTRYIAKKKLKQMVACQSYVLNYCQDYDIPIFILEYDSLGRTINEFTQMINLSKDSITIQKKHDNGFYRTELAEKLHDKNVKKVLLMGINASACVRRTAEGAIKNDFGIMTSGELIASPRDDYVFKESINWYKRNGVYQNNYRDLLNLISR